MATKKGYNRFFVIFQEEDKGFGIAIDKQPTGYAKIEIRNGKCKITAYVQNLKHEKAPYYFCMMDTIKPPPSLIRLGEIKIDNTGKGEATWEYSEDNIGDTSKTVDKLNAAIVLAEGQGYPAPLMGFTGKDKPMWRELLKTDEPEIIDEINNSDTRSADSDVTESEPVTEELVEEVNQTIEDVKLDSEAIKFQEYEQSIRAQVQQNEEQVEEQPKEEDLVTQNETREQPLEDNTRAEIEDEIPSSRQEEQNSIQDFNNNEITNEDTNSKADDEDVVLWRQPIRQIRPNDFRHDEHEDEHDEKCNKEHHKEKHHGKCAEKFHELLKEHEEIDSPFEEEDDIRWWKIPYKNSIQIPDEERYPYIYTIFYLNMIYPYIDYIKYFYNRGYYYFGIKYDDDKEVKYIIYGIEGKPVLRDQPCNGMTGFYKCVKLKNKNHGAWIMIYNPRTGNFMRE